MYSIEEIDREIINSLQGGFPICAEPFKVIAESLGISSVELRYRIENLILEGFISRFGPMFQIEKIGGAFSLCAMKVPEADLDRIAVVVNSIKEVAHNYQRSHEFNMWFVLGTETPEGIDNAIAKIETLTGHKVFNMPKEKEYFVGARFAA